MADSINLPHEEINVSGVVADDARLLFTGGDNTDAVLMFEINSHTGLPYFVRQVIGKNITAQEAARSKARLLRKNAPVRVYAKGLRYQCDHHVPGLRLVDITDVIPLSLNHSRCEAHSQEA